jgi:hypothetical protein
VISFIKQHFGSIIIAIAMVIAAFIYASSNRYEAREVKGGYSSHIEVLDKWNGTVNPDP